MLSVMRVLRHTQNSQAIPDGFVGLPMQLHFLDDRKLRVWDRSKVVGPRIAATPAESNRAGNTARSVPAPVTAT
jgi:hypothetical protein